MKPGVYVRAGILCVHNIYYEQIYVQCIDLDFNCSDQQEKSSS